MRKSISAQRVKAACLCFLLQLDLLCVLIQRAVCFLQRLDLLFTECRVFLAVTKPLVCFNTALALHKKPSKSKYVHFVLCFRTYNFTVDVNYYSKKDLF